MTTESIGSLARSFGTQEVAASSYSGQGKSYFLTDLIQIFDGLHGDQIDHANEVRF